MSLATYTDLQTAVANWLMRAGDTEITGNVADFITLAESRIHYGSEAQIRTVPLRIRAMEFGTTLVVNAVLVCGATTGSSNAYAATLAGTTLALGTTLSITPNFTNTGAATLNLNGGGAVAIVSGSSLTALSGGELISGAPSVVYYNGTQYVLLPASNGVPLPPGYLAMRSKYLASQPHQALVQTSPEYGNIIWASNSNSRPLMFQIEGDTMTFTPPPDGTYYLPMLYWKKFPALSNTQATNWLMTNKPDTYLYATLLEASIFISDDAQAQKYALLYAASCNALQSQDVRDRYDGTMTIRTDVQGP